MHRPDNYAFLELVGQALSDLVLARDLTGRPDAASLQPLAQEAA